MSELLSGVKGMADWRVWVMLGVGLTLVWLAVKKEYEPNLLLPMGFGCLLANIPLSSAVHGGFLDVLTRAGISNELFPILIFIGVGAMIDFGPLLQDPEMLFFGAAAQFGIFFTMMLALLVGRIPGVVGIPGLREAAAIGIIGAADGPTSIYVATRFAPQLLAPITVAAYSYMSLVPIIQPPVIRALTTREERMIRMENPEREVSRAVKIIFPIAVTLIAGIVSPMSVALIGSLMFGNLLRESGVTERLSKTAQNELSSLVTILLGITIGSTMSGEQFLTPTTLLIIGLGLIAFVFDTAGGVLFAKFINLFRKKKINPMIGACGISAFPMSARVIQKMAQQEDGSNFIIMHAVGANVAGQVASIIAGGLILALVR
ncbi:MAG: sodium ion-translocating decarboxylase subunit beta [Caldisericota bacterium]|jgi:sodium ion-translocating decarboxylase beta subunit|nr:sodium ion-translocating decarboxylase subunit beta [Caldisericota bacterium]